MSEIGSGGLNQIKNDFPKVEAGKANKISDSVTNTTQKPDTEIGKFTKDEGLKNKIEDIVKKNPMEPNSIEFGKNNSLTRAKDLVTQIIANKDPKAEFALREEFNQLVNQMSKKDLVELSKSLNTLMQKTDGSDHEIGELQNRVLNEIGERDSFNPPPTPPMPDFDPIVGPTPSPIPGPGPKPPYPGPKPPFDNDGGFTTVKYSCAFATRTKLA